MILDAVPLPVFRVDLVEASMAISNVGGKMNKDRNINLVVKAFKIGNKVKELRQKNHYTLQDLAGRTGLSKPFLSQIENDHVVPPIATLLKLARALDVGMAFFFQDEVSDEKISVTRQEERIRVERRPHQAKGQVNYVYVALETKTSNKNMEPFLVEFPIQDTEDMVFYSHEGEEFLYVMEGSIEFRSVDRVEVLNEGDSIYFHSDLSHGLRCIGDKPAKALAVISTRA
jgi:transcriptional regulator with XRE-family HTH domain